MAKKKIEIPAPKPRLVNSLTYKKRTVHAEHVTGESETIDGQALTIRELFAKHRHGLLAEEFNRDVFYTEDETHPSLDSNFDLSDIDRNRERIEELELEKARQTEASSKADATQQTDENQKSQETDSKELNGDAGTNKTNAKSGDENE